MGFWSSQCTGVVYRVSGCTVETICSLRVFAAEVKGCDWLISLVENWVAGFGVGVRNRGLGFRVSGCMVQSLELRIYSFEFRV